MLGTLPVRKLALVSLFLLSLGFVAQGGPEPILQKEKEVLQPVAPGCDFFRANEWDFSIWGTYVFSANPGRNNVPNDDPFTPDLDPEILTSTFVDTTIVTEIREPKSLNPDERIDLGRQTKDTFLGRDDSWGGGVDIKFFWSKYFGIGVEGFVVDTETDLGGSGLVTLTGRYPMGRFAPYIWAGAGALAGGGRVDHFFNETHTYEGGFVTGEREFWTNEGVTNDHVFFNGQVGLGFEVRLTCHIGLMADFAWNFIAGGDGDRREVVTSPGGTNFDGKGSFTFPNNTAINVVPGANADNKDFGMVRFGLTFAY
jgi:hypothetical protein